MIFNISNITDNTYQSIKAAYEDGIRDFTFIIDSYGGSFEAGLRIYDLMRSDAENKVSARVDGNCMSAATIILLSAPKERRTATKHSCFLAHSPLFTYNGDINKTSADQIKADIDAAYNQLKGIYLERTNSAEVIDEYMKAEKTFYADEAVKLGFINRIEELYNKKQKSFFMNKKQIKDFIFNIIDRLKNEVVKTKDGKEFDVVSLEVGSPANTADGVYELEDGTVITVEGGVIVDLIAAEVEEPELENEGEETEETAVEEEKEVVEQVVEQVATEVEEAVTEEEIATIVEQAVEELKEEIINKYAPMVQLVNELGGLKKLQALKNVKSDKKNFVSEQPKTEKRSLAELLSIGRK